MMTALKYWYLFPIKAGYGLKDRGLIPDGHMDYFLCNRVQAGSGIHTSPVQYVPGVKRLKRETGYSPPSISEIKRAALPPLPHYT
jgi:hypothetical protein